MTALWWLIYRADRGEGAGPGRRPLAFQRVLLARVRGTYMRAEPIVGAVSGTAHCLPRASIIRAHPASRSRSRVVEEQLRAPECVAGGCSSTAPMHPLFETVETGARNAAQPQRVHVSHSAAGAGCAVVGQGAGVPARYLR